MTAIRLSIVAVVCLHSLCLAQTKDFFFSEKAEKPIPMALLNPACVDAEAGVLRRQCMETGRLQELLEGSLGQRENGANPYYVIHMLRWKDVERTQVLDSDHWYVFHNGAWYEEDFSSNNRIFGKREVVFLYLHVNKRKEHTYSVKYRLKAEKKTPAFLDHFISLATLFSPGGAPPPPSTLAAIDSRSAWGVHLFERLDAPSDLTLSAEIIEDPAAPVETSSSGGDTPAPEPASFVPSAAPKLNTQKFDNEGLYHVDFTVGIPFRKFSELQYVSASGTLTPVKVDREKAFAFFNWHPVAVDVKKPGFSRWPYLASGVAIGSKPLQKLVLAAGYGPAIAQFYAGVLFNTQLRPTASKCGSIPMVPVTGDLKNKTCPEFTMGLNLSVGSVIEALKPKKETGSTSATK